MTALSQNSTFLVNSVLDLNGFSNTVASLAGTGTVTNSSIIPAILTTGGDNSSASFVGTLADGAGTLGIMKTGFGTLTLTGNNSYSGGTDIFPGTLVAAARALGTGLVDLFGGTLVIPTGATLPNQVNFAAGGVLNNAGTLNNDVSSAIGAPEALINSGVINGNVSLGGSSVTVQLFTSSQIAGTLSLGGAPGSTLILDGPGQQLVSRPSRVRSLTSGSWLSKGAAPGQSIARWMPCSGQTSWPGR